MSHRDLSEITVLSFLFVHIFFMPVGEFLKADTQVLYLKGKACLTESRSLLW